MYFLAGANDSLSWVHLAWG